MYIVRAKIGSACFQPETQNIYIIFDIYIKSEAFDSLLMQKINYLFFFSESEFGKSDD